MRSGALVTVGVSVRMIGYRFPLLISLVAARIYTWLAGSNLPAIRTWVALSNLDSNKAQWPPVASLAGLVVLYSGNAPF